MPSIRYFNQTAPFWDFIANLESSGVEHPFFSAYNAEARQEPHASPPDPAQEPSNTAPQVPVQERSTEPQNADHHPHGHPWGSGFPGGFSGYRGGPHIRGGPNKFRRGGRCGGPSACGRGEGAFPSFAGWNMDPGQWGKMAEAFAAQLGFDTSNEAATKDNPSSSNSSKDFTPPADIFDTEDAYIVHVSLPGVKKEDVGVNWDADKSELNVAGVVYRPGDEDFLKTLALDERQVGVFERKIRLGSRASPAQVDVDSIAAKMEDGVLIVTIPKLDREYVEVKKVDIE